MASRRESPQRLGPPRTTFSEPVSPRVLVQALQNAAAASETRALALAAELGATQERLSAAGRYAREREQRAAAEQREKEQREREQSQAALRAASPLPAAPPPPPASPASPEKAMLSARLSEVQMQLKARDEALNAAAAAVAAHAEELVALEAGAGRMGELLATARAASRALQAQNSKLTAELREALATVTLLEERRRTEEALAARQLAEAEDRCAQHASLLRRVTAGAAEAAAEAQRRLASSAAATASLLADAEARGEARGRAEALEAARAAQASLRQQSTLHAQMHEALGAPPPQAGLSAVPAAAPPSLSHSEAMLQQRLAALERALFEERARVEAASAAAAAAERALAVERTLGAAASPPGKEQPRRGREAAVSVSTPTHVEQDSAGYEACADGTPPPRAHITPHVLSPASPALSTASSAEADAAFAAEAARQSQTLPQPPQPPPAIPFEISSSFALGEGKGTRPEVPLLLPPPPSHGHPTPHRPPPPPPPARKSAPTAVAVAAVAASRSISESEGTESPKAPSSGRKLWALPAAG